MIRSISRFAGALAIAVCGLATAAPQLVVPVESSVPRAKSNAVAVRFNADEVFNLPVGAEVELTLPNGSRHTYLFENSVPHGGGMTTWIARSPLTGDSERAVITYSATGAWGWMQTRHGDFRVYPGDEHDWLVQSKPMSFVPEGGGSDAVRVDDDPPEIAPLKGIPAYAPASQRSSPFGMAKAQVPSAVADVMIIYTVDLANKLGAALLPMLNNLIASANQAYTDSGIALSLRLVNATKMDLANTNGSSQVLGGMRNAGGNPNAAAFESLTWGISSIRNTVGADYVALVRDGPTDTGGIGALLFNPVPGTVNSTSAFSVNNYCASGCEGIFAHELGHNMGNIHDRATVAKDGDGTIPANAGVFPYSFGHYSCANGLACNPFVANGPLTCTSYANCAGPTNANDFGTIMSYFNPRVMKFSNPGVTCVPTGGSVPAARPCGEANLADNARSMNDINGNLAALRNTLVTSLPGSLQFTNTAFTGKESGGTLVFTVSRAGGTAGAVSVSYAVTGGTAVSGTDFTAASGVLNWAAGDAASKTITVTLANDGLAEGIESFTATLSTPVGNLGVYLGHPTVATGLILEPWPIGGVAPVGFSNPVGPAWAIANDSNNGLDTDTATWKSGAFTAAQTGFSTTRFTGSFSAGFVAFAYRVSSYPNFGTFRFSIDGAVQVEESGASGWKFVTIPITAGAHTLEWSYEKELAFFCANAIAPPGTPAFEGAACADRVWIDQVSLPLAAAGSSTALVSSVNPSTTGQSVTFTATVSGSSGAPTGTVNFRDGITTITGCGAVTLASGSAACATSGLANGTRSITAVYSGNATYAASTSAAVSQVVAGLQRLTAGPATLAFGGQSMSTTAPALTTTLTNVTGTPVVVSSVTPPAHYAVTGNTCSTVAPAATCQITVTFTPGAEGALNGAISVAYAGGGPTPVFVTGTGERSLVTHYYRSILRRAPDDAGKAYWTGEAARVAALGANVNETWYALATSFYSSAEYIAFNRDNTGFLTDLYTTFFNRAPDGGGLTYWNGLLTGGMPREVVLVSFMFSTEFNNFTQAIFGSAGVRAEMDTVVDFYRGLLSRLPDSGGFNYWVGRFRTAQCAGAGSVYAEVESISSGFSGGAEYGNRGRSNAQFVGDMYNSFLRRGGDLDGVQYWVSQLASGARTRENVRQAFITTPEFSQRVQAIINQGCL